MLAPDQWSGPGTAHVGYAEHNQRKLLSRWADYLERPAGTPARTSVGARAASANGTSPNGTTAAKEVTA